MMENRISEQGLALRKAMSRLHSIGYALEELSQLQETLTGGDLVNTLLLLSQVLEDCLTVIHTQLPEDDPTLPSGKC